MKVCNGNELLINLYIDGELSASEARELEAHLQVCPACRQYCDELCMVNRAIQDIEPPKGLHALIMAAVDAERQAEEKVIPFESKDSKNAKLNKRRPRWIGTVAAMLIVALVGAFGMENGMGAIFNAFAPKAETAEADVYNGAAESASAQNEAAEEELKAEPEAPMADNKMASPEPQPVRIEELMHGWFNDAERNVTVVSEDMPGAETETGDSLSAGGEDEPAEAVVLDAANLTALDEMLGETANGYGFYLVAAGRQDALPAVFADQAEDAEPGYILVICVRNDERVRQEIVSSMEAKGFEVYTDDGAYFKADAAAEEALVIVELTE